VFLQHKPRKTFKTHSKHPTCARNSTWTNTQLQPTHDHWRDALTYRVLRVSDLSRGYCNSVHLVAGNHRRISFLPLINCFRYNTRKLTQLCTCVVLVEAFRHNRPFPPQINFNKQHHSISSFFIRLHSGCTTLRLGLARWLGLILIFFFFFFSGC
jgi:hypothetical protein